MNKPLAALRRQRDAACVSGKPIRLTLTMFGDVVSSGVAATVSKRFLPGQRKHTTPLLRPLHSAG